VTVSLQAFDVLNCSEVRNSERIISEANFVQTCSTLRVQKLGRHECKRIFSEIDEECGNKGFLRRDDFVHGLKRHRLLLSIANVRPHGHLTAMHLRTVFDRCAGTRM
jgi:hypothetical protein